MKKIYLLLFVCILAISCKDAGLYRHFYEFDQNRWQQSDKKEFIFTNEADGNYDLVLQFSHVDGFQFANVTLEVSITTPDGKTEMLPIDLKINDASGKSLGSCAGDVCDLNFNIKSGVNLTKGNYKVVISNAFNNAYLPNVIGVGLTLKHSK